MIYLTSDQHYFHEKALERMPNRVFSSIETMNLTMISNHNNIITDNDLVIMLGDFVMGKKWENIPIICSVLKGKKVLIYGNHDMAFNDERLGKKEAAKQLYLENGIYKLYEGHVKLEQILKDCGFIYTQDISSVVLSHFPFESEEHGHKYRHLYVKDEGQLLFSGHSHQLLPIIRQRNLNVGVDAWGMFPISLDVAMNKIHNFIEQ